MNREIKFRGRRLDNNEWVEGSLLMDEYGNSIINYFECGLLQLHEVHIATVCQYTGFKALNDAEIYEDDLVEVKFGDDLLVIMDVVFENGEWCLKNGEDLFSLHDYQHDIVDIFGNISDNINILNPEFE